MWQNASGFRCIVVYLTSDFITIFMMRKALILALTFFLFSVAKAQTPQCDASLWNHVYHSYRLQIDSSCMNITGKVYSLIYEADGDIHIRITLDSPFLYMLNAANYSGELGKLVVEPICATTVTQADAITPCRGLVNNVYIPNVGEYVVVTGPYVTDNDHGWNELHPVTKIAIVGAHTGIEQIDTSFLSGMRVYPIPSDDLISFEFADKPHTPVYIIISDVMGRSGGQYQLSETRKLDITSTYLPDGVYYYTIKTENATLRTGQFNVIHRK